MSEVILRHFRVVRNAHPNRRRGIGAVPKKEKEKKMSYEGYEQHICAKGHRFDIDAYDDNKICHCGAPSVFYNCVDETNYESNGIIPPEEWDRFCVKPDEWEQCSQCQHRSLVKEATYQVPTEEQHKTMTYYLRQGKLVRINPPSWEEIRRSDEMKYHARNLRSGARVRSKRRGEHEHGTIIAVRAGVSYAWVVRWDSGEEEACRDGELRIPEDKAVSPGLD